MSDAYPIKNSPYQPKSADERAAIMTDTDDPVSTVMTELGAILLDGNVQQWLVEQGSVPVTLMLPWINDLYSRGITDGTPTTPVIDPE